jgi:hypothetical protein
MEDLNQDVPGSSSSSSIVNVLLIMAVRQSLLLARLLLPLSLLLPSGLLMRSLVTLLENPSQVKLSGAGSSRAPPPVTAVLMTDCSLDRKLCLWDLP